MSNDLADVLGRYPQLPPHHRAEIRARLSRSTYLQFFHLITRTETAADLGRARAVDEQLDRELRSQANRQAAFIAIMVAIIIVLSLTLVR